MQTIQMKCNSNTKRIGRREIKLCQIQNTGAALKLGKNSIRIQWPRENIPIFRCWMKFSSYTDIVSQVPLGTMDIPLSKLVGTKTAERSISFAK